MKNTFDSKTKMLSSWCKMF